jgi:uncharacterized damage-inducible protein DinB
MDHYGGRELAEAFRTVRRNTAKIAEDIPEEHYGFRAVPEVMSVAEELAHIAASTIWHLQLHGVDRKLEVSFEDFGIYTAMALDVEKSLTTREAIRQGLRDHGEEFASWLETLTDEQLHERVSFPAPVHPPSQSRFAMLLGAKEHEMHHRGKLMLVERLIGIVPHLTRQRQNRP